MKSDRVCIRKYSALTLLPPIYLVPNPNRRFRNISQNKNKKKQNEKSGREILTGVLRSNYLIIGIRLSGIGEVDKVNSVRTDVIGKTRRSSINTPGTSIILGFLRHLHIPYRIREVPCLFTTRISPRTTTTRRRRRQRL